MSRFVAIGVLMLAVAVGQTVPVSADNSAKDLAARIEAIPVQTLTVTGRAVLERRRIRAGLQRLPVYYGLPKAQGGCPQSSWCTAQAFQCERRLVGPATWAARHIHLCNGLFYGSRNSSLETNLIDWSDAPERSVAASAC